MSTLLACHATTELVIQIWSRTNSTVNRMSSNFPIWSFRFVFVFIKFNYKNTYSQLVRPALIYLQYLFIVPFNVCVCCVHCPVTQIVMFYIILFFFKFVYSTLFLFTSLLGFFFFSLPKTNCSKLRFQLSTYSTRTRSTVKWMRRHTKT